MKTITIHLDAADIERFDRMKEATKYTWDQILFAQLEQWEATNGLV